MHPRSRQLVLVCAGPRGRSHEVAEALVPHDFEVRSCGEAESMIEAVLEHRPRAIVYALEHQSSVDFAVLHLLRSVAASVPLVLVGEVDLAVHGDALAVLRAVAMSWSDVADGELADELHRLTGRPRRALQMAV